MGGAVSSGRDNNELIDNLMGGNYIRTRSVERVFRALDRAEYMTPESRDQAYKDLAWRNGALHMSSPCIYSEVMEGLELRPGLSFLNIGSGTGYLSTLAGLILGCGGISHGVEVHSSVVDYANKKLGQFLANSPTLDEFDFCEPRFFFGNGLCLPPQQLPYDRVYCGAGCPNEYENYFKQLIKVGGILVMPLRDSLLQVRRVAADQWVMRNLLTVSFATLRVPPKEDALSYVRLEEQTPPRLQALARGGVRAAMLRGVLRREPELREPEPRRTPPAACPRRICIPIEPGGAVEGLNILHDLDADTGANEMNALLSLVIRMDQNRVAGAIRFDRIDSSHSETDSNSNGSDSNSDDSSDGSGSSSDDVPSSTSSERRVRSRHSRSRRTRERRSNEDRSADRSPSDTRSSRRGSNTSSGTDRNGRNSDRDRSELGRSSIDMSCRRFDRDRSASGRTSKDKDRRRSDRDASQHDRSSKDRGGRKSDRTSSEEAGGARDKSRRKSDRKSSADGKCPRDSSGRRRSGSRRSGSSGSLLAFEFQATDRTSQPTTSSGAGRSMDTSPTTSENDGGNKNKKKTKKSSRRHHCHSCKPAGGEIIPAEVELCFRGSKEQLGEFLPPQPDGAATWDETNSNTDAEEAPLSGHDEAATESTANSKPKRQKLDSGIGENTVSSSSPDKSKTGESDTDDRPADSATDETEPAPDTECVRFVHKRKRAAATAAAAAAAAERGGASTSSSGEDAAAAEGAARRRSHRPSRSHDARRVRLSILMKRAVKELPLPYPLKKYVNLGRCFEF